jgi:protoporphyrinogen oxidase
MLDDTANKKISLAVIGGGISGIAAALELAKCGQFEITLFEKGDHLGGLSDYYQWNGMTCDRFYHVILSTDSEMLRLIRDLGIEDLLCWKDTKSGFYGEGRLVSMSTTLDFIRFPFLSLWQKLRLGCGILYSTRIKTSNRLDRIYAREWLTMVFGRRVYERIWDPLLRSKLGSGREKISAAFIWATICRLYGARSSGNKQERMGYIRGGYKKILTTAEKMLRQLGVDIMLEANITSIRPNYTLNNHSISCSSDQSSEVFKSNGFTLHTGGNKYVFDKVLLTTDCVDVLKIANARNDEWYWNCFKKVKYLGIVCLLVVVKRKLSPYYAINLLDTSLPFTGVIEATNIIDPKEIGGHHLVFLPKYFNEEDSISKLKNQDVTEIFLRGLKKIYPELQEDEVLHTRVFRETYVQPLHELNTHEHEVNIRTPINGMYVVNTAMIYNSTVNNNAVIELAKAASAKICEDLREPIY